MRKSAIHQRRAALAALLALALTACGNGEAADLADLDNSLIANEADPALTSALEDQILVDPSLTQQSNRNAVRPPELPVQAQYPVAGAAPEPRLGERSGAPKASAPAAPAGCGGNAALGMDSQWANRLPPAFPLYPGARVTEAAGSDANDCRVRVVSFRTADRAARVLDWYRTRAVQGDYSAEHQIRGRDHVLGGAQPGGAYFLIVTPVASGSEVALIVNSGR
jgi:hypothetical protein